MKKYIYHKWAIIVIRTLFGLNLFLSGFLILFHFIALPPSNARAEAFISALIDSGYVWIIVKTVEIIVGLLLILNVLTPLLLVIIFPISLNIFLFNTILWPAGAPSGIFILISNVYLLTAYYHVYKPLFKYKTVLQ